jgi:hypothetical protein
LSAPQDVLKASRASTPSYEEIRGEQAKSQAAEGEEMIDTGPLTAQKV